MFKISFLIAKFLLTAVILAFSVTALQFECRFTMFYPTVIGDRYTCDATVVNSGSASLESVTGDHESGKSNEDVEYLYINQQNLASVPGGISDFFKNLDALLIRSSSLVSISANDLRPFPRLVFLYLDRNQLTAIDGDLFMHTPLLQLVYFSSNQIQHIGYGLVTNLNSLRTLNFKNNVCIDQSAVGREDILLLATRLSILCPPLDATTIEATITTETTLDQCKCDIKILALEVEVDNLQKQLIQENAAIERKLLEIETKLRELGAMRDSN